MTLPYRVQHIFVRPLVRLFGDGDLLLQRLGHAHGIDRICGLVGTQTDNRLHLGLDSRRQHVVCADNIGAHGLHGEEFAGGHLLQRRRVEYVIHPCMAPRTDCRSRTSPI